MHDAPVTHEIILRPVGVIESAIREPFLISGKDGISMREGTAARKQIRDAREAISKIVINEDLSGILDGIEEYSHLVVLYWAHAVPEQSRHLRKVHPMGRKEFPLVGIFGTCSPARPNPVLMTVVRLCRREGNILLVQGLDAVDKSPVIDIKPYVAAFYPRGVRTPEWMERIQKEHADVER
jgi:tRNA-Thr(GGU) m(6)t(6)A37 methyltransferase TsaA